MQHATIVIPDHQNVSHPHASIDLRDVVRLVTNSCALSGRQAPGELTGVRDYVSAWLNGMGHSWITGMAAMDLLDAAIDGKDISASNRVVGSPTNKSDPAPANAWVPDDVAEDLRGAWTLAADGRSTDAQ